MHPSVLTPQLFMLGAPTEMVERKFDWSLLNQKSRRSSDRQFLVWSCWEPWNARTVLCQFASLYAVQFPLYAVLFIRCGTPLIICAIYDVISCASVVICSTFVVICWGFAIICGAYVIICSDFSIIPTFCHSMSTVLSLYRVFYALYGVQTILPRVHFALFAVLSSLYRTGVIIYPQCKTRVLDPSSSQPDATILVCFRGKVES